MPKKSVVIWNSMIAGYGFKGDSFSCIQLFKRIYNEGVKPTLTTLSSIIMQLLEGKFVHGYIIRNRIQPDIFINISLMDFLNSFYFSSENFKVFLDMENEGTHTETLAPVESHLFENRLVDANQHQDIFICYHDIWA